MSKKNASPSLSLWPSLAFAASAGSLGQADEFTEEDVAALAEASS